MKTSIRILGATLGATAIVGGSSLAANACDVGGHEGSASASSAVSNAQAFGHHRHHGHHESRGAVSFEQQQAAIVDRLTQADQRLSSWIEKLQLAAADNPDGEAAQQLADLQQRQSDLESLIAAVKGATDEDELRSALESAQASSDAPDQSDTDGTVTAPATPAA